MPNRSSLAVASTSNPDGISGRPCGGKTAWFGASEGVETTEVGKSRGKPVVRQRHRYCLLGQPYPTPVSALRPFDEVPGHPAANPVPPRTGRSLYPWTARTNPFTEAWASGAWIRSIAVAAGGVRPGPPAVAGAEPGLRVAEVGARGAVDSHGAKIPL